ncbi:MAG: beta-galactosidase, partial [Maritimibacter sp.]
TAELAAALEAHEGQALIGPRSNAKTRNFATPVPLPPNLARLDCTVARVESVPPGTEIALAGGGALVRWREFLEGEAEVLERSADGWPVLMSNGHARYLAATHRIWFNYKSEAQSHGGLDVPGCGVAFEPLESTGDMT